jgi:hypothetical protein
MLIQVTPVSIISPVTHHMPNTGLVLVQSG